MELPQQATLFTKTDLGALAQVLAWFDQFNHLTIPRSVWIQCQLALAEGFTNAVRHAHQGRSLGTLVEIEVKILKQCLEIRIWDYGAGFDLEKTLARMPPISDTTAEGGRGLRLMKRVADHLSYTPTIDQRNCLLIVKYYSE